MTTNPTSVTGMNQGPGGGIVGPNAVGAITTAGIIDSGPDGAVSWRKFVPFLGEPASEPKPNPYDAYRRDAVRALIVITAHTLVFACICILWNCHTFWRPHQTLSACFPGTRNVVQPPRSLHKNPSNVIVCLLCAAAVLKRRRCFETV